MGGGRKQKRRRQRKMIAQFIISFEWMAINGGNSIYRTKHFTMCNTDVHKPHSTYTHMMFLELVMKLSTIVIIESGESSLSDTWYARDRVDDSLAGRVNDAQFTNWLYSLYDKISLYLSTCLQCNLIYLPSQNANMPRILEHFILNVFSATATTVTQWEQYDAREICWIEEMIWYTLLHWKHTACVCTLHRRS